MEAPAVAAANAHEEGSPALLVLTIVGASVLCGLGLLAVSYWLITFRWLYFAGLAPLAVGAYLLFTRATGPDHA